MMASQKKNRAQVMVEFLFCMMVVLLMMYGTMMVFKWTGEDLVHRRQAHDAKLIMDITPDYGDPQGRDGPLQQIDPYITQPVKIDAIPSGYE